MDKFKLALRRDSKRNNSNIPFLSVDDILLLRAEYESELTLMEIYSWLKDKDIKVCKFIDLEEYLQKEYSELTHPSLDALTPVCLSVTNSLTSREQAFLDAIARTSNGFKCKDIVTILRCKKLTSKVVSTIGTGLIKKGIVYRVNGFYFIKGLFLKWWNFRYPRKRERL